MHSLMGACSTKAEKLLQRVGLHASVAFYFLRFGSVEVSENSLEFLVFIPRCQVYCTDTAVQSARCHQILVSEFFLSPSFYVDPPFAGKAPELILGMKNPWPVFTICLKWLCLICILEFSRRIGEHSHPSHVLPHSFMV